MTVPGLPPGPTLLSLLPGRLQAGVFPARIPGLTPGQLGHVTDRAVPKRMEDALPVLCAALRGRKCVGTLTGDERSWVRGCVLALWDRFVGQRESAIAIRVPQPSRCLISELALTK